MNRLEFMNTFKYVVRHDPEDGDISSNSEYYVQSRLYHALLNNNVSEQSFGMNAMENASKNAG